MRVQGVMKIADLPGRLRSRKRLAHPLDLLRIHVIAVQRKELGIPFPEAVVPLSAHVERLVKTFAGEIVIAERGVELHAGVQQSGIRILEFSFEIRGRLAAVEIVAEHDHEVEWKFFVASRHLIGDIILGFLAGSIVADDREPNRSPFLGKLDFRGGRREQARQQEQYAEPHKDYRIASGMKSTIRFASRSRRIRSRPATRYSSSGGSFGRLSSRDGGVDCSGNPGGYTALTRMSGGRAGSPRCRLSRILAPPGPSSVAASSRRNSAAISALKISPWRASGRAFRMASARLR